jgi:hypothetical protein
VVLDEDASGTVAFLLEAVALRLYGGVVVCRSNEGDDEVFDGGDELVRMLDRILQLSQSRSVTYLVYLICSVQVPILNPYRV